MLKVELGRKGIACKVSLDGVDISRFLRRVSIDAEVGDLTTATLQYFGAVVVEGEAGRIQLEQAPMYVACGECNRTLRGAPSPVVTKEQ